MQYNFFPFSTVDSRLRVAVLGGNFLWQDVHFIGLRHAWTQKKTIAARWSCFFNWCRRPDSNRHALRALDFESSASANSATSARVWCNEDILALKHHFVNGFPRFGVLQSERKFIGRVNTDWPADGDACQFSVFHGCLDGNGTARFLEDEDKRFLMTQA